jgi:hypothetical protein
MKKRSDPVQILDGVVTSDEYDHFQDLIKEALSECDEVQDALPLPFLEYFTAEINRTLIASGFNQKAIKDKDEIKKLVVVMSRAGRKWGFDIDPPGFPHGTYELGHEKKIFWVKPEIEAALRALSTLMKITKIIKDGSCVKVYLHTMALVVNLIRAGIVPELANMGSDYGETQTRKRDKRRTWGGLTKENLKKRNQEIKEHFQKSKLTPNSFAKKHSKKYKLSIRQISNILNS